MIALVGVQDRWIHGLTFGLRHNTSAAFILDPDTLLTESAMFLRTLLVALYHSTGRDFWTEPTEAERSTALVFARFPYRPSRALQRYIVSDRICTLPQGRTYPYWCVRDHGPIHWTRSNCIQIGPIRLVKGNRKVGPRFFRKGNTDFALCDVWDARQACWEALQRVKSESIMTIQKLVHA